MDKPVRVRAIDDLTVPSLLLPLQCVCVCICVRMSVYVRREKRAAVLLLQHTPRTHGRALL
jgi:hypothetical protein